MARFDSFRLDAKFDVYKFSEDWTRLRFVGGVRSYHEFWFEVRSAAGKNIPIRKLCLDWDPVTDDFVRDAVCPYKQAGLKGQTHYIANAIIRQLQDEVPSILAEHSESERQLQRDQPGGKFYAKELGSSSWTPVRVVRVPVSVALKLKTLSIANGHDLADPEHGADLLIRYDGKKPGDKMYGVRLSRNTNKLSAEERRYLRYALEQIQPETLQEAQEQWRRLQPQLVDRPRGLTVSI